MTIGKDAIFVFGSNLAGRHGKGAAKDALNKYGAIYGIGEGPVGQSYALPTKDARLQSRTLPDIQVSVNKFTLYANQCSDLHFYVTRVGCGLAGFTDNQIAPMFKGAPPNCQLPEGWRDINNESV